MFAYDTARAPQPGRAKKEGLTLPPTFSAMLGGSHLIVTSKDSAEGRAYDLIYLHRDDKVSLRLDEHALRWMIDERVNPLRLTSVQRFVLSQLRQFGTEDAWSAVTGDTSFRRVYAETDLTAWKWFVAACYPACEDPEDIFFEDDPTYEP